MKLTIALATFIAAAVVACIFVYQRNQATSREKATLLAQQSEQLANLRTEQQRLSGLAAEATNAASSVADHQAELAKLRTQAEALRKQTNRVPKQAKAAPAAPGPGPASETHPPEYWQELHQAAGTKPVDARDIAMAAYMYAMDHGNQVSTNIDQLTKYLPKTGRFIPSTNRFEFIFAGSLDRLKGIPRTSIAIVRDTQTWMTPDGKQARVYGMIGGVSQIVTSDDNFQSWEAEHVISGPGK